MTLQNRERTGVPARAARVGGGSERVKDSTLLQVTLKLESLTRSLRFAVL